MKESFANEELIKLLVSELQVCLQNSEETRTDTEIQMIEMILYVFRNSLSFNGFAANNEQKNILVKILDIYLSDNSVFDALIYISQDFTKKPEQYGFIIMSIVYELTQRIHLK